MSIVVKNVVSSTFYLTITGKWQIAITDVVDIFFLSLECSHVDFLKLKVEGRHLFWTCIPSMVVTLEIVICKVVIGG